MGEKLSAILLMNYLLTSNFSSRIFQILGDEQWLKMCLFWPFDNFDIELSSSTLTNSVNQFD